MFDSFADHPRKAITRTLGGKPITSTAAGRYQFLSRTWDECKKALSLPDFSPESQDRAAVFLIKRRGALQDVEAGRIEAAIRKCNREWASLPGSPYGQPTKTLAECLAVYHRAGGEFVESIPTEPTMPLPAILAAAPAILAAAIPSLIAAAPDLLRLMGDRSKESSDQYAQLASKAATIAVEATQAVNVQEAVERLESDPEARTRFQEALKEKWYTLAEVGPGIAGAQQYNLKAAETPIWKQPAFVVSCLLIPLVYYVAAMVLQFGDFSQETKAMVVAAIITGVLGGITGFFLGSSVSSRAKDELLSRVK
jgi:hypothetical protein